MIYIYNVNILSNEIDFSVNSMLRALLLKKLPIIFTAHETRQFVAQGTAPYY